MERLCCITSVLPRVVLPLEVPLKVSVLFMDTSEASKVFVQCVMPLAIASTVPSLTSVSFGGPSVED